MEKKPLFKYRIPVAVVTGKHGTGKTIWGLSVCPDPADVCHYDMEYSATTYDIAGLTRVDVPTEMRSRFPAGYRSRDLWTWWLSDVTTRVAAGKFRVLIIDTVNELESGLQEWVRAHPERFGATALQYEKMSAIAIGHAKQLWKQVLSDLASRVECLVCLTHMGRVWQDAKPTDRFKPKGLETLYEMATLYLELRREVQSDGKLAQKPSGRVLKTRLGHMVFLPSQGDWEVQPLLPPALPDATPREIRKLLEKPVNYHKLDEKYLAVPDKISEEDMAMLRLATAQAELEATQSKLALADRVAAERQSRAVEAIEAARQTAQSIVQAAETVVSGLPPMPELPVPPAQEQNVQQAPVQQPPTAPAPTAPGETGESGPDSSPDVPVSPGKLYRSQLATILALRKMMPVSDEVWLQSLNRRGVSRVEDLATDVAAEMIGVIQKRLAEQGESAKTKVKS